MPWDDLRDDDNIDFELFQRIAASRKRLMITNPVAKGQRNRNRRVPCRNDTSCTVMEVIELD